MEQGYSLSGEGYSELYKVTPTEFVHAQREPCQAYGLEVGLTVVEYRVPIKVEYNNASKTSGRVVTSRRYSHPGIICKDREGSVSVRVGEGAVQAGFVLARFSISEDSVVWRNSDGDSMYLTKIANLPE